MLLPCSLTQVNDLNLPLKHNQLVVARFISLIREDARYWCRDLLAEGKRDVRREILLQKVNHDALLFSMALDVQLSI